MAPDSEVPNEFKPLIGIADKMGSEAFGKAFDEGMKEAGVAHEFDASDGSKIRIDFVNPIKDLHPAIDIVDDKAFIGITLPCTIEKPPKIEGDPPRITYKDMPFIVTSERELWPANEETLRAKGYRLAHSTNVIRGKWSEVSTKKYLAGTHGEVRPGELYDGVLNQWNTLMELDSPSYYHYLTCFTCGTYFFVLFDAYGYAYLHGMKGVGKTKILQVAENMCFNAILSAEISTSAFFRLIQSGRITLLMDETEALKHPERGEEIKAVLRSGYKRGGKVYRSEKQGKNDNFEVSAFEIYGPKMIANIGGIDDILADRSIRVIIRRGINPNIINREVDNKDKIWGKIRDALSIMFLTHWREVKEIYESLGVRSEVSVSSEGFLKLNARERELWRPIMSMAIFFDKYRPGKPKIQDSINEMIEEFTKEKAQDNQSNTTEYLVVQILLDLVKDDGFFAVKTIKGLLENMIGSSPDWLTNESIGRLLTRIGFKEKRRLGTGMEYRLTPKGVEDLAARLKISRIEATSEGSGLRKPTQPTLSTQLTPVKTTQREGAPDLVLLDPNPFPGECSFCHEKTIIECWVDTKPSCRKCAALKTSLKVTAVTNGGEGEGSKSGAGSKSTPESPPIKCPRCGVFFANEKSLEDHLAAFPTHQEAPE